MIALGIALEGWLKGEVGWPARVLIGAALLVPTIVSGLARGLRAPLRRVLGVEGLLAHANLAAAIPRLSISIAALAVSLSMMVAVAIMIGSFRETVVYWVGQTLQADLFVGPGVQPTVGSEQTLSATVIDTVGAHPDVEAVDDDALRHAGLRFASADNQEHFASRPYVPDLRKAS